MYVYSQGELVRPADAKIGGVSSAAMYGRGVFTTIALLEGDPFLWDKHWQRLTHDASILRLDIAGYSSEEVRKAVVRTGEANEVGRGRARVTFFDDAPSDIWPADAPGGTSILITAAARRTPAAAMRLTVSATTSNSHGPLSGVKSCNYLERSLHRENARARGFDECVVLNERGEIASASMANVFWETNGKLYTPSLATGCLPGTTREYILENIECEEVEAGIEALADVTRIFLTSAGLGVTAVNEFEGRPLDTSEHVLTAVLPY